MKRLLFILSLAFSFCYVNSQNITISFAATGESTSVDTVTATNLTTNETISFSGDEELVLHEVATNIEDLSFIDDVEIVLKQYDNFIQLNYLNRKKQLITVKIVSLSGKVVASYSRVLSPGVQQYDVSTAAKGLYLLSVITENGINSVKVIQNSEGSDYVRFSGTRTLPKRNIQLQLKGTLTNVLNYTAGDIISYEIKSGDNITVVNETPTTSKTITAAIVTCKDFDENNYKIVQIGTQTWMAENLKVTHYPDGTAISYVTDNTVWVNLGDNNTDDAYCFYNNDASMGYGALYTWAAAMGDNAISSADNPSGVQGICPDGWHLPSDAEWKQLEMFLGMTESQANGTVWRGTNEGSKLAGNANLWYDGVLVNNTEFGLSGFTALPGGHRSYYDGSSTNAGSYGMWWSSLESSSCSAYSRHLSYYNANVYRDINSAKSDGFSVRCLRD